MPYRLFSYVITHDTGFAPNPFGEVLTLATCKPKIRVAAQVGDWLLGTGSARAVGNDRVVYAAQVSEVMSLANYGDDHRFTCKRPSLGKAFWNRVGDCIYFQRPEGTWVQRRNLFHNEKDVTRDLGGLNALVCKQFWYFGGSAPLLPDHLLSGVKRGPGHRCDASEQFIDSLVQWFNSFEPGLRGEPFMKEVLVGTPRVSAGCSRVAVVPIKGSCTTPGLAT